MARWWQMAASSESTYTWTSPHRALGSEAPDPRSDCWSADLWVSLQMTCRSAKTTQTKRQSSMVPSQRRFQTKFSDFGLNLIIWRVAQTWVRDNWQEIITSAYLKTQRSHCMQMGSESTNNFPFDATNSYKTQLFLVTASVFPHAQGLMLTSIIK